MTFTASLLFALGLIPLVACSGDEDRATAGKVSDVVDPTRTAEDAVIAIISPNGASDYVCSGEIIGPRTILSAAHCFEGGNYDKTGWTFEIVIGADVHHPASTDKRVAVREIVIHPDYASDHTRPDGGDADIAVAHVDEDLDIPALPWRDQAVPLALAGSAARYAGFGNAQVDQKGVRHYETARIEEVETTVVRMSAAARNPCHGDSGGPLLVTFDGIETIIAVGHVAYGDCTDGADYTKTDVFADFLRENLR